MAAEFHENKESNQNSGDDTDGGFDDDNMEEDFDDATDDDTDRMLEKRSQSIAVENIKK